MVGTSSFLMKKMVPVSVTSSEGRWLFPMPNPRRRPHSFVFDIYHVEASESWRSFDRGDCLPDTGEEVPMSEIWRACLSW